MMVAMAVETVIFLGVLSVCTDAALVDPLDIMRDDISRIKVTMESVGEQLENFNGHYLTKLESRMTTSATSLAHIDSNVKNLQERAHVWDTFQLHVSAWNEQIKSLDKKLDILSRGAEKWGVLDDKVATLLPLDYKISKMMAKLEDTDAKIAEMHRTLSGKTALAAPPTPTPETPLFSEYTSRGVLSALKEIEVKVNGLAGDVRAESGCNAVERDARNKTMALLNDIAAKVDVILDHVIHRAGGANDAADDEDDDYHTDKPLTESAGSLLPAERAFLRMLRRMLDPSQRNQRRPEAAPAVDRALEKTLERMAGQLESMVNATWQAFEERRKEAEATDTIQEDVAALLDCCKVNDLGVRGLVKSLEALTSKWQHDDRCVGAEELERRSLQTQSFVVTQLSDVIRKEVDALAKSTANASAGRSGGQRKKSLSTDNTGDAALTHTQGPDATATATSSYKINGCHDLRTAGETESGVYSLASGKELNEAGRDYYMRLCDMTTDGGGWTVIQRRGDFGDPRENFSVSWRDYKLGFGSLHRQFWFGNDFIHRLTNENDVALRVELWDFDNGYVYADYESFRVDSEEDLYRLWVEGYHGNATDSLASHNGYAFSTYDRNNDIAPKCCPCSPAYGGGWWFYSCFEANLNGEYHKVPTANDYFRGIIWELWRGDYSLRRAEMKIRPQKYVAPPPPPPAPPLPTTPHFSVFTDLMDTTDDVAEDP